MSQYPMATDTKGWTERFKAKYRKYPLWILPVYSVILLPFAIIYWAAMHFEAIQDVIDERW